MTQLSRSTLEANLIRHQKSANWAAQAETLLALVALARKEEDYSLAQDLYMQAWAASHQASNKRSLARAMLAVGHQLTRATPVPLIDMNLWDEAALELAIEARDRQLQAVTYLAISKSYLRWQVRGVAQLIAFACYDWMGHLPSDIETPKNVNAHGDLYTRYGHSFREQILARYRHIGDVEIQAYILLAFGESALWAQYYDEARADLEQARDLFQTLGSQDRLKQVLLRLMRMARRIDDYALYHDSHRQILALLTPNSQETLALLLELALVAPDYRDWRTARDAYQQALMVAVAIGEPRRQCSIYWQLGQMEHKARRSAMGQALCQWSIALMQTYDPYQVSNYQRELKQMRVNETK